MGISVYATVFYGYALLGTIADSDTPDRYEDDEGLGSDDPYFAALQETELSADAKQWLAAYHRLDTDYQRESELETLHRCTLTSTGYADDESGYYLAVKESIHRVYAGTLEPLHLAEMPPEWETRLRAFAQAVGLHFPEAERPKWWITAVYNY